MTLKLLAADGLAGISMERVAAAAGVSKVTMYTRWRNSAELVSAALGQLQSEGLPESAGNVRDDLVAHLTAMKRHYEETGLAILGSCLADQSISAELLAAIRLRAVHPRREHMAAILRAGKERGELDADLDIERVVSMLSGVFYADYIAGIPMGPGWAESVVDQAMRGLARPSTAS
jgi:AcrR family transcriptional regulator